MSMMDAGTALTVKVEATVAGQSFASPPAFCAPLREFNCNDIARKNYDMFNNLLLQSVFNAAIVCCGSYVEDKTLPTRLSLRSRLASSANPSRDQYRSLPR